MPSGQQPDLPRRALSRRLAVALTAGTLVVAAAIVTVEPAVRAAPVARVADPTFHCPRALTDADVSGRTLRQLAIMRNSIFARAGQPFRKQWLHDYFSALPWYQPKTVVDPKSLSPVDQQNADFLSRYEIALPRADLERRLQAIQDRHRYAAAGAPLAVAFGADGQHALLASADAIRLIDLASGRPDAIWSVFSRAAGPVAGKSRAAAISAIQELETIDLPAGGAGKLSSSKRAQDLGGRKAVFSADGRRVLAGPAYDTVEIGDGDTEEQLADGSFLAADVATGKVLFKHQTDDGAPCLALTTSGDRALVVELDAVSLWDVASGKTLWTRKREPGGAEVVRCTGVTISPDGALAATAAPAAAAILDMKSGQPLRRLALPGAKALAFSPGGDQLLVGGGAEPPDGRPSLEIWDVKRGQRIRALAAAGSIAAVAWSPDGSRALSDGSRGPALWDAAAGRAVAALAGFETWWNRDEQIEAVLLSRALGRPLQAFAQLDFERTPFDAPALLDELVPIAQLKNMSRRDLRLLRNMVYARHGRPFRSPILRDYFEKLDWYKADPAYADARLTSIDRRNIKLIQSTEIELGGPINDRQHKEEDVPEA